MDNLLKKSKKVYQVIGLDENHVARYVVLNSYKSAEKYVRLQENLTSCEIVPIQVYEVSKK